MRSSKPAAYPRRRSSVGRGYKVLVGFLFIVAAVFFYIVIVVNWLNRWKNYFFRAGDLFDWAVVAVFSWIYVKIMKYLWKIQVRVLSEL